MNDPAILFYTSDFLTGILTMTNEQVGKYIKLLCLQHQKFPNYLTKKDMLNICITYDEDIFGKFIKNLDGKFYNQRMENEILKRKAYSESRRINRMSKKSKKKNGKNISKTYVKHMENENENEIVNRNRNESKIEIKLPFDSEIFTNAWTEWKQYKKDQFKFTFKNQKSEQASLMNLNNLVIMHPLHL